MTKLLRIAGYKVVETKYGQRSIVYGLLYNNTDKAVKGNMVHTIWVNEILTDDCIGKDLYVEFNALGKISKTEVK